MSCFACTKTYGFFCKEVGCPNCGYSFCTKCLKKEIEVPRCKNELLKVCLKCFEKLEKEKAKLKQCELPKNIPKESGNEIFVIDEPIEAPVLQPMSSANVTNEEIADSDDITKNLDSEISKRLQNLKSPTGELPTTSEMASRLANLKGVEYKEYSNKDILTSRDTRTDTEKTNDLLQQFLEENEIDKKTFDNPIIDIEKRLSALRGIENSENCPNKSSGNRQEEEDESMSIKKIVERYVAEAQLPEALISEEEKELIAGLPQPSQDTEELPWCTICNEDAVLRCLDCDGDLFCRQCFKECHDDEDFRAHRTQTYSKPPNIKENHF